MQPKLTIQERLKDLRVERSLTLEQLSAETGISKSALGKYEADDFKDISPFSMVELAKFYGVSTDYLLGLTEQKNHPNTELDALHLGDDAIEVLRTGKFNHRLLSELICHKDFQRFMLDAEIYDVVPDKAVLFVDGHEQDTKTFTLNADEWAALPGTAFPYSGSIGGGYTYYTIKKATPKLNTYDHFAYVQGYPDGTVKPAGNITRAETAAILFRLMDNSSRKTYLSTKSGFRDVTAGSWYNTYVATLNNAGVITDSANGYFRPNEAITRAELAAMLAAFTDTTRAANYFNDVTANYWAANAIAICAKLGWINGYPDGSFRPDRNVTRAELMAMINRATGRAPKSADAFLPGMKTWSDNTADKWYYLDVQEATNSHSYAVSPTELWTALTAAPDWSRYE